MCNSNVRPFILAGRRDTFQFANVIVIKTDVKGNTSPWVNINSISGTMPQGFILYQNYPNPFNPNTKITYSIPATQYTILKVYDILGKEVKTLVNEIKPAGTYSIVFNGSNLPSGVYFYRLVVSLSNPIETGEFRDIRRMVLIK